MLKKDWELFFRGWTLIKTVNIQLRFLDEILAHTNPNDQLLEIGTGSGFTSLALYYSGRRNLIVSDKSHKVLERIHREMPCLVTQEIDMFCIHLPDQSVDCIFHQGLMEHFSDSEIVTSLQEQARVAKLIVFDVPNDRRWNKVQEFGNERFLSVTRWKELIAQAGLRILRVNGRRLPKVLGWLPYRGWAMLGTSSIFVCGSRKCT